MIREKIKLSKFISTALRHTPERFNLKLDKNGWSKLIDLLNVLHRYDKWKYVSENDIKDIIKESEKKRFEISGGKIRALYGHSTSKRIKIEEKKPPEILYHGTAKRFIDRIKDTGLLPMGRQYVHLSTDVDTAQIVGKRRDSKPIILKIKSDVAYQEGVKFYQGNENIWLADKIDSKYIPPLSRI